MNQNLFGASSMTSGTKAYFFEQDRGNRNVFKRVRQVHKKHHRRKKRIQLSKRGVTKAFQMKPGRCTKTTQLGMVGGTKVYSIEVEQ